jgi:predicted O-linked N-acetylglucosamine transferase (SPINDLY family)
MPSLELAKLLRAMEIDIAIDLSGHTEGTRLDVLSHRPAPVQMTYLGFPGTLGLPFIDYLIADPRIIPPELQKHYAEKILYLPHCYLPRDMSVKPSTHAFTRSDFNLPDDSFVFCCFNHEYKINPVIFDLWLELLHTIPNSVLWLMKLNSQAEANLTRYVLRYGIDPSRIIYASRINDIHDHLARYQLADLFLDTFPYNGHTTVSDSLSSDLLVLTLQGQTFASKVASSLITELNFHDNITFNLNDYKKRALFYSANLKLLNSDKSKLYIYTKNNIWPNDSLTFSKNFFDLLIDL